MATDTLFILDTPAAIDAPGAAFWLSNAAYMLAWQLKRAESGVWDAYTERLLIAGRKTAKRAGYRALVDRVDALIGAESEAA